MSRPIRFFVVLLSILLMAERSPAPIVEENPTPAPEQTAKPKTKRAVESQPNRATHLHTQSLLRLRRELKSSPAVGSARCRRFPGEISQAWLRSIPPKRPWQCHGMKRASREIPKDIGSSRQLRRASAVMLLPNPLSLRRASTATP